MLLITGVGSLIHIYSVGYMAHDPGRRRFFAYLNLFIAAMLLLVLGNNYVVLYVGWEGVGLASYLLIGSGTTPPAAATAAKKAFIMNRVGDVGLALAIFLMFATLGHVSYTEVVRAGGRARPAASSSRSALLLLLGACGKSGQFPLQAWLPDAMEGPTPVSALIHAATMVTAGVYLIARSHPIYDLTETGRLVVAIIGAITLLIGAIIGCAYDDIKKVLAYSTVSQIGYMFLAVGLGPAGYALGIVHLLAHGFFKAGLFLGAGSVMHAMNDEVDMRRFGGLWRVHADHLRDVRPGLPGAHRLPVPVRVLHQGRDHRGRVRQEGWQGWVFGGAALLGAGLTAFYMTRLMLMTFFGERRWSSPTAGSYHPHESPPVDDRADDRAGARLRRRRCRCCSASALSDWLAPVARRAGRGRDGVAPLPHAVDPWLVIALVRARRRWPPGCRSAVAAVPVESARAQVVAARAGRAHATCTPNAINEALSSPARAAG